MRLALSLLLALGGLCGCASSPAARGPSSEWIARNGGISHGPEAARVEQIAHRFDGLLGGLSGAPVQVHVLKSTSPTAMAWPSGDIFLTQPLVALLSDNEIAAAIAHELGHLMTDHHIDPNAALTGSSKNEDAEIRADDAGLSLLSSSHTPPQSLGSALSKIVSFNQQHGTKSPQLTTRIARLP